MASKTRFVCSACGYESAKWLGRCPDCGNWNTFSEIQIKESSQKSTPIIDLGTSSAPSQLSKIKSFGISRQGTGFAEFDRVLGGGIVDGSAVLLSGDPGVGKSTLLLEIAGHFAKNKKKVLYVSGEESEGQIKIRAERVGIKDTDDLLIFSNGDVDRVIEAAEKTKPALLIIDSIQTMSSAEFPGFAGSLPQLRHATSRIVSFAKKNSIPTFIIGHVTKEGEVAGPMLLSHMVDCVLYFEGSETGETGTKILRSFKNRFGDTSEVGIFAMEEEGLVEILDTSSFFTEKKKSQVPGSCLAVVMEGSRPLIIEVQALVVPTSLSFPRRVSNGIHEKRLELLLAVIQKHLKIPIDRMDVFVNVVGGLKIMENSADLAVCLAVLSSFKNKPLPSTVAIAEIGLLSELKSVLNERARVKEAKKLGFKNIITQDKFSYLNDIIKAI